MTRPTSLAQYVSELAFLDAAVADPEGATLRFETYQKAYWFRVRCHAARSKDRTRNQKMYEPGHPLWGVSAYDCLRLSLPFQADTIRAYKVSYIPGELRSLSTGERIKAQLPDRPPETQWVPPEPPPPVDLDAMSEEIRSAQTDAELGDAFEQVETVTEAPPRQALRRI